jgi:vesicle coat complex subunit
VRQGSALVEALKDPDATVRQAAFGALANIGIGVQWTVARALEDEDVSVRRAAARILGRLGPEGKDVFENLHEALKDKDAQVRREARIALYRIDRVAARKAGVP